MKLSQLIEKGSPQPKPIRSQSKEQFFTTKRPIKRLKLSNCTPETLEKQEWDISTLDKSLSSIQTDGLFKVCRKDLQSTFGEQYALSFKATPPRRKRNMMAKIKNDSKSPRESQLQSQTSLHQTACISPLQKSGVQSISTNKFENLAQSPFKVDDFEIISKIGEGTYGFVYKAIQKQCGFICALKVLSKQKMKDLGAQQNVGRQIKINSFLDHPNITQLYGFFHDKDYLYLINEYATDKNLYEVAQQQQQQPKYKLQKGLQSQEISNIVQQICQAVVQIHKNDILHRDIKPENILLTMFHTVKLCDFGWSVYNPAKSLRSTICGTPLYLAPELIKQTEYDESVDVWAIGVLTYELFTEQIPFKISEPQDLKKIVFDQIMFDGIRNKTAIQFMRKAMQKDPAQRKSIFELVTHPFLTTKSQNC